MQADMQELLKLNWDLVDCPEWATRDINVLRKIWDVANLATQHIIIKRFKVLYIGATHSAG